MIRKTLPLFASIVLLLIFSHESGAAPRIAEVMQPLSPQQVQLGGLLGRGAEASRLGRLRTLTTWEDGRLLNIFRKEDMDTVGVDWLGEHAGKWMIAAARAAVRTDDAELLQMLQKTADFLMSMQEPDGYLGTYAPSVRFTSDVRINFDRTWDIWNHSYLILGFLEMNRYWPDERYLNAALRMGGLLYKTFYKTGKSTAYRGNHFGLSGTILLEPVVELYKVSGEGKYLDFAEHIVEQMEGRPELRIISQTLAGNDLQRVGDGKIYQLCWNYVGIAKLYEITGNSDYLKAAQMAWDNIVAHHLTADGSPWGGIGGHHEIFNRAGYWVPYGLVETCNTMSWIHLNRDLLRLTGEAKYAEILERTAYNALLGAQYPDGERWCYFIFPNGRRHEAIYRDCCRSSGMVALEEIPPLVYGLRDGGVSVNLYAESAAILHLPRAGKVEIAQKTAYPTEGKIALAVNPATPAEFPLFARVPEWADEAHIAINGEEQTAAMEKGRFVRLQRKWKRGDTVLLDFPLPLILHRSTERETHRGADMYSIDWMAVSRGPLVYAVHGLIDGVNREAVLPMPEENPESLFVLAPAPAGCDGPALELNVRGRGPITLLPYYEAGGREVGTWRLTWMQVDWQ